MKILLLISLFFTVFLSCKKKEENQLPDEVYAVHLGSTLLLLNANNDNVPTSETMTIKFTSAIDTTTAKSGVTLRKEGTTIFGGLTFPDNKTVVMKTKVLDENSNYSISITSAVKSPGGVKEVSYHFKTAFPPLVLQSILGDGKTMKPTNNERISLQPEIQLTFAETVLLDELKSKCTLSDSKNQKLLFSTSDNKTFVVKPETKLSGLTKYTFSISNTLVSEKKHLFAGFTASLTSTWDSSPKFPTITEEELLTLVQRTTFKYFWDYGHAVSGMARERNDDSETVTTGGTGFGIMAILVGASRHFVTHAEAMTRIQKVVTFLSAKCTRWHGAFSHWLNGTSGSTIAFGDNNGADIVETSYLMEGLLCARQYFDGTTDEEKKLRQDIEILWNAVEWDWFTQEGKQKSLYWQYNPNTSNVWSIAVSGWNECLITYILAASSTTHTISKEVYDNGWAQNGNFKNRKTFYTYTLPLGEDYGGPLFFEHYSFLGINPTGLTDDYADYERQTKNHTLINYEYCKANPKQFYGYSDECWGLTASDIKDGYTASSPTNDGGFIAPTAALSSMPFTPAESIKAMKFFYYNIGDKVWKDYGFVDAFSLQQLWYADSYLAIDQGPIVGMIENYRTGLLWNLFTSCPEVKAGMKKLGFKAPYLP